MKCQICGKKTDWDSSVGLEEFLICNSCYQEITNNLHIDFSNPLNFIFACGIVRREKEMMKKERKEYKNEN